MVRKKTKPINFTVNQRDLMGGQTVEPPGTFVSEILQMPQNRRHDSNPAIAHETVDGKEPVQPRRMFFNPTEYTKQIKLSTRTGDKAPSVEHFFVRAVNDREMCRTFPWGRLSFDQNMRDIVRAMDHFGGVVSKGGFTFPSFCTSLELLSFEAIPQLKKKFRELRRGRCTESSCPWMCKSQYIPNAMTGFPLSDINKALGKTKVIESILLPSVDEEYMLERIFEE
ncbi:hypothetical protein Bca101_026369 [Brassica carinata]